jgi:hypothetical protein
MSQRRERRGEIPFYPVGNSVGDGILRVVGTMGAIGGLLAVTAKVFQENHSVRSEGSPPVSVERQILAGSKCSHKDDTNQTGRFTMEDLEILASEYREEVPIASDMNDFSRLGWLSEMQQILHDIIEVRRTLDVAQQHGNFDTVAALTPQVSKMQQDLARRRREEILTGDDVLPSRKVGDLAIESANDTMLSAHSDADIEERAIPAPEQLSYDEVHGIIKSLDSKMGSVDTGTHDGLNSWRKLHAEKKQFEEISSTFDQMEEATRFGAPHKLAALSDSMKLLQSEVIEPKHHVVQSPKLSIFQGIKKHFGFRDASLNCARKEHQDNGETARHRKKKAGKRKSQDSTNNHSPKSTSNDKSRRMETIQQASDFDAAESEIEGSPGNVSKMTSSSRPTVLQRSIFVAEPASTKDNTDTFVSNATTGSGDMNNDNPKSPPLEVNQNLPPPKEKNTMPADPSFSPETEMTEGSIVSDVEKRLYYVAQDNETLDEVVAKLSSISDSINLQELVDANAPKYDVRTLKAGKPLVGKALLILPPNSWPVDQYDEDDDAECDECGSAECKENIMLLCDFCNAARHMKCCSPALSNVPAGEWYCSDLCNSTIKS